MLKIGIITGSTRPNRKSLDVATWMARLRPGTPIRSVNRGRSVSSSKAIDAFRAPEVRGCRGGLWMFMSNAWNL